MSVAFIAERYAAGQSASSNNLVSASFTPNANALLILAAHVSDSITSITGHDGGGSWVQIGSTLDVSGRELQIWACHTGPTPSAGTVTITIPYNWNIAVSLLEFTGADVSGSVTASFGTVVTEGGYDLRHHSVPLAAFANVGNATFAVGLLGGGTTTVGTFIWSENFAAIGDAGTNGSIGAAWCNYEQIGEVQVTIPAYNNTGFAAVEIKADSPNTGFDRVVGNALQPSAISPETIGPTDGARFIQFTVPDGGTLGSVFASLQDNGAGGDTCRMYLYDASGNLLDTSNETVLSATSGVHAMYEFTGMSYNLEASTVYYLGVSSENTFSTRVCQAPTLAYFSGYETASWSSDLSAPPDPATITVDTVDYFIYAEYTPAAGSPPAFPYQAIKQRRRAMQTLLTR